MTRENDWWDTASLFAGHLLLGTLLFLIFTVVSISLSLLVHFLPAVPGISAFTEQVLNVVERLLLIVDAVLYSVYVIIIAWRAFREMTR